MRRGSPEKREHDRRRYDRRFRQLRDYWKKVVPAGGVVCPRCGEEIKPDDLWDLGHSDAGEVWGPEHRRCNRATAGRKPKHSREW